ncbi:unnamed protein product [Microthlaspi erraticum]|uniref:F-box associated beta-propeller type 3 domain-containing protein n=1 Tax=Microthlaspi erraticum TaxID=1685480 RepID=A0A6D2KRM3_9BRAS|nr:unnamed protein product [Microthlaspi erraticum]
MMIGSFDVVCEEISLIHGPTTANGRGRVLSNYKGQLSVFCITKQVNLEIWSRQDKEWTKRAFIVPLLLHLHLHGMSDLGELLLAPKKLKFPLEVIYMDVEKETKRSFTINRGEMEDQIPLRCTCQIFPSQLETFGALKVLWVSFASWCGYYAVLV